jgi:lipopolysaccharide export system protein LptA
MSQFSTALSKSLLAGMFFFAGLLVAAAQNAPAPDPQGSTVPNALQGFARNRNEPIKIDANRLEVHDKDKLAVFSGNVYVQQGDTNMRCPELKVFYEGEVKGAPKNSTAPPATTPASGETKPPAAPAAKASATENNVQQRIKRIEAFGGVIVMSKDQKATGDRADFDIKSNTVTLLGNVVVTQGPNVMKGDKLIVDLSTSRARMEAGTKGSPGRVQGLFVPSTMKEKDAEAKKAKSPKAAPQPAPPQ